MYCTLFLFTKFVSGAGSFSFSERTVVSIIDLIYFRHSKPTRLRRVVKDSSLVLFCLFFKLAQQLL